ncbi:MlaD family protein [Pontimicrobium sp. MEBiC01747]
MRISREVKAAILVILGIVFFIFGFNYLKGKNLFESSNVFYTEFDYNGLTEASVVTIKGNTIGKVTEIIYDFKTGKTRVSFIVDEQLKFSKNSKIRMYELGVMGGNGLAIIDAEDNVIAESGDFITSEVEEGLVKNLSSNFSDLSAGLDTTLKSADTLLVNLNNILVDDSEKGLKTTIAELNETLRSFKSLSNSFKSVVTKNKDSLTATINNFNAVSKNLAALSNDLKDVELSKTVDNLDKTLTSVNNVLANIEKGEGSLGKLMKDEKLYNNLEVASGQLKELLQDFKLNPKRYINVSVFGRKDKKGYVKPEDERE